MGWGTFAGGGCGQPREQRPAVGGNLAFELLAAVSRVGFGLALPLLPGVRGRRLRFGDPRPLCRDLAWGERVLQEGDQVDQAEGAGDDHPGPVGGQGGVAFSGLEEDDQGAGVVVADPGVDAVAVAGGDVEHDGGGEAGGPGGGAVGRVEAGDLEAAVGDCFEVRPEEGIAGDQQDRLCHGPNLPPTPCPDWLSILPAESGNDNESPTSLPWVPGDMLRA
jgi:hypothetical protein